MALLPLRDGFAYFSGSLRVPHGSEFVRPASSPGPGEGRDPSIRYTSLSTNGSRPSPGL